MCLCQLGYSSLSSNHPNRTVPERIELSLPDRQSDVLPLHHGTESRRTGQTGLEPVTLGLTDQRSTYWSYCPGSGGGSRTHDLRIMKPLRFRCATPHQTSVVGIEPTPGGLEPPMLPLHHTPIRWRRVSSPTWCPRWRPAARATCADGTCKSDWQDSNLRSPAPKAGALPNWATV